ncbi:MAG: hypothetical protein V7K32_23645 [Nostoc sp.]
MTKKLLIVDDEERIRELVQACLEPTFRTSKCIIYLFNKNS